MKKLKSLVFLVVMAAAVLAAGCGAKFDASGYVKGELDAVLRGEITDDYLKLVDSTKEEVEAEYEKIMDENMAAFSEAGLSDDLIAKYREYIISLLKSAKYTVGEAAEEGDEYVVPVTVEPILLGDAMSEAMAAAEADLTAWAMEAVTAGTVPTDQEILEKTYEILYTYLNESLSDIGYGEGVEYQIRIFKGSDGKYTADESEVMELGAGLLDMGEF